MTTARRRDTPIGPAGRHWMAGFALVGVLLLAGCATTATPRIAYSPEALAATTRSLVPDVTDAELVVPFRVSAELVERGREIIASARSEHQKVRFLSAAITATDGFGLAYEPVATASAAATVDRGHGNCMSLTSVFVGLARELGMQAFYIDASDRVNDIRREDELIVDSGHIAAVARTERGWSLVDYDGQVQDYRTFRIIDDLTALAHYYNNLGYELIDLSVREQVEIPWDRIRRSFELATAVRPRFARAHNNLGVVHSRQGDLVAAERSYRLAIEADPDFAPPHHNLGNLHQREGDLAGAVASYDRAVALQKRNPFLHTHRGMALYKLGRLEEAAEAFQRAINLKDDYVEPLNLLAQVYSALGRHEEADRLRATARTLAGSKG